LWAQINTDAATSSVSAANGYTRVTYEKDITNYQELSITESITALNVGDTITSGQTAFNATIIDKDDTTRVILIESTDDWSTETSFSTYSIEAVDAFGSETAFKGKIKLTSTSTFETPKVKDVKWVLKV